MKNFTRILISTSLTLMMAFTAYSQDVFNTSNVGIGTTSPTQKLDVHGNVKFSGALMPNNLPGTAGNILLSAGPGAAPTWLANGTSGQVLTANGSGIPTWSSLSSSGGWLLTGNSGTIAGTNYLGTTDDESLQFEVNGKYAGSIDPINNNYSNSNVYLGSYGTIPAIYGGQTYGGAGNNDGGAQNVAIGLASLGSSSAPCNSAGGCSPNISNVAVGVFALPAAVNGAGNTAVGAYSQRWGNWASNAVGFNTSVGAFSMYANSTGQFNTAVGFQSMMGGGGLTTATVAGNYNTAIGYNSFYTAGVGGSNTALGSNSLYNTIGGHNTAVGDSALYSNTSGTYNTAIGYGANVASGTLTNATAIGAYALVSQSNSIVLGQISGVGQGTVNTNVGIGTTTPAQALEIGGNANTIRIDGIGSSGTFNSAPSATTDQIVFAKASGDLYSLPNGSSGQVLTLNGGIPTWQTSPLAVTAIAPLQISGGNLSLVGTFNGGVFYGTGTGASETGAGPLNDVLVGQGPGLPPTWVTIGSLAGGGDNWGTQVVYTDSDATSPGLSENTITGQGISGGVGNPLKIAQNGASTGQILEWNGITWAPHTFTAPSTANIVNGGVNSAVVVSNGNNQVVGSGNAVVDVQGTAGGVLYGTGAGSSALFTSAGTTGQLLQSNGSGAPSWVNAPSVSNVWALTGNNIPSFVYGSYFIGTTNTSGSQPFEFYVNNAYAGVLDASNNDVYLGPSSGGDNTSILANQNNNTAIGSGSLASMVPVSTLNNNMTAIGYNTLHSFVSAVAVSPQTSATIANWGNTAVGANSLFSLTTGVPNTALGYNADFLLTTGYSNIAVGFDANYSDQTGIDNVAIGDSSLFGATTPGAAGVAYYGNSNTGVGVNALGGLAGSAVGTTGSFNTAMGYESSRHITTGNNNTSEGYQSGYANKTGFGNVAIGYQSLFSNTASGNTAVGTGALFSNTTAGGALGPNVAIGDSAMYHSTTGVKNVAVGYGALASPTTGASNNVAVGYEAMMPTLATGTLANNVNVGYLAGQLYTSQSNNVAVGAFAMLGTAGFAAANPSQDIAIGAYALYSPSTGANYDIAIGSGTAANGGPLSGAAFTGNNDIAIGYEAGTAPTAMTTGSFNVNIGYEAYSTVPTASENVAIGYEARFGGTASANDLNTAVGYFAQATGTSNSTALGASSIASGASSTAIGVSANASGISSTAIGPSSSANQTNSTAIGASTAATSAANTVIIGNGGTPVKVGIGTSNPLQSIEVAGTSNTVRIDGLASGGNFTTTTPSLSSDQLVFARAAGDLYSMPNPSADAGYVLTLVGSPGVPTWAPTAAVITATPPLYTSGFNVYISSLAAGNGGVLYGTGTGAAFTPPAPSSGYVLEGEGPGNAPQWVTLASIAGTGDNWGTQVAVTDSSTTYPTLNENTITGNGSPGSPLKLAKQNALTGQILAWNGTTWLPSSPNASLSTSNIVNGGGSSVITVANGSNQVVGGSNAVIDVQGTAGGVVYGTGAGSSAAFSTVGASGSVLTSTGGGAPTWSVLGAGSFWALTGNSGTVPGSSYIGTTDDNSLYFGVNGQYAGSLDAINNNYTAANVYLGGPSTSAPIINGAGNKDAGDNNVAIGLAALGNAGGPQWQGNASLNSGTSVISGNVAVGAYSLSSAVYGGGNTAIGAWSQRLFSYPTLNTQTGNTSSGAYSLYSNSTGLYNTASGYYSMYGSGSAASSGNYNTAEGYKSLYTAGSGNANTANGSNSLYSNTTGSRNTAVGDSALYSNTTGGYNSALGYGANVSSGSLTNATAIGAYALAGQNNTIVLGQIGGVGQGTTNTNVCIGTNTPASDAALAIKTLHLETQTGSVATTVTAGTGVTSPSVTGTDVGGNVAFTVPSSGGAAGTQVTVNFAAGHSYTTAPTVIITAANPATGAIMANYLPYVGTSTTTGFTISFTNAPTASAALVFNYFVIETQ